MGAGTNSSLRHSKNYHYLIIKNKTAPILLEYKNNNNYYYCCCIPKISVPFLSLSYC